MVQPGFLSNLKGPTVVNQIGARQLYTGMKTEREVDLIRRGGEINRSFFLKISIERLRKKAHF